MAAFSEAILNYYNHYQDVHTSEWCRFHPKVIKNNISISNRHIHKIYHSMYTFMYKILDINDCRVCSQSGFSQARNNNYVGFDATSPFPSRSSVLCTGWRGRGKGGYLKLKLHFVLLLWPKTQDGNEYHCKHKVTCPSQLEAFKKVLEKMAEKPEDYIGEKGRKTTNSVEGFL